MRLLPALLAASFLLPTPAAAQAVDLGEVQRQIAAMQAEIARLSAQVAELSAQVETPPSPPVPSAAATSAADDDGTTITWRGAPEISGEGGWSFKPRGRLQIDTGLVSAPSAVPAGNSLGVATEFRRAYIGFDGTLPGGFGYRAEIDIANSSVQLTDFYLTYKPATELTLTIGQHKPFQGLEEMTSDLFTPFMERTAFGSAFGFERRVGLSGAYAGKNVLVQLGVFADNVADLNSDGNNSYSVDGRLVFSPKLGDGQLHIAGSAHLRQLNDAAGTVRYNARPFLHTTDIRLVDTRAFTASGERSFGAELAYIRGPFHATIEGHRMTTLRPGLDNPTFWGGYAEIGMLLTSGDKTAYRGGVYDRIRPANPLNEGGIGAIQLNLRYDKLDLNGGVIRGGRQDALGASLVWIPTDYVRFLLNYGHLWISDAAISAGLDTSYQADTLGMRAQFDF